MMGHREELKSGDEFDAFTRFRRFLRKYAGRFAQIKRRFNKRIRKQARMDLIQNGKESVSNEYLGT